MLDVGTGAGLPGIVIAIVNPDIKVSLIDKVGKKITFIKRIIAELDIKNIETYHDRVELLALKKNMMALYLELFQIWRFL